MLEDVIQGGCDVLKNLSREVVKSVCHRDWVIDLYSY